MMWNRSQRGPSDVLLAWEHNAARGLHDLLRDEHETWHRRLEVLRPVGLNFVGFGGTLCSEARNKHTLH